MMSLTLLLSYTSLVFLLNIRCGSSFVVDFHQRPRNYHILGSKNDGGNNNDLPTVAIVGSGAVGGYYGARLWETGAYSVKFQMRGENYQASVQNGFNVTSVLGNIYIPPESLQAYESTDEIGPVDWVIVALKSTAVDAIPDLIYPLLQPSTRVLAIMNGMIEDDLLQQLKKRASEDDDDTNEGTIQCCGAIYGGMALVCSNRITPGHVDHSYAGLLSGGVAAYNPDQTNPQENEEAFNQLWEPTSIDTAYEPSLLRGRWKKMVWNLPFNGISVALGGVTVDKIVTDPGLRRLAYTVMDETIAAANADLVKHGEQDFLGEKEKKQMMDLSDAMGPYRTSTMIDFTERNSMEVRYLFRKPVERANKLNVPVPHLETLVTQIEFFQKQYNLF
ncbi:Catalyzes the NADPH-dependent reduction of ketopantoate into pantoic acid (By similarity) [Seminavis robusta]|uniref:Catalyzes the NADPH-dependent reduction of ketopantoate into pantoic acid By similarity n=1 Tax=Seminavis robusta TaxID=568900 RepID=A0A9N8E4H6_9STRA|nr:Catalyzes the NADPH-dependent reduction of ketopantoate into pantoic acid (By similarity) [Seminavis robusta]|eukprot:Sro649_g181250.1 Catalyzes the NADPH-dependent reduction of ketopantoate into pantoic acid (By similarity) (389) ;mRNA; r:39346-40512